MTPGIVFTGEAVSEETLAALVLGLTSAANRLRIRVIWNKLLSMSQSVDCHL